jgi:hypothetical protein
VDEWASRVITFLSCLGNIPVLANPRRFLIGLNPKEKHVEAGEG